MHKPSGPVRSRNSVEIEIKGKKPAPERTRRWPFAVQCWRWGFHHSGCFIQAPSRSRLLSEAEIAGRHSAYARDAEHEIGNAVPIDVAADLRAATRHFVTQLPRFAGKRVARSEEHTSELQSLMRISYAVFCLKKKNKKKKQTNDQ